MSQIKIVFDRVRTLLEKSPKYRDSDQLLVARMWWEELQAQGIESDKITAQEFMEMYRDGKITSSDSISRARRKVNEELPNTKGLSYKPRKIKEEEIKQEIKEISNSIKNEITPELFR